VGLPVCARVAADVEEEAKPLEVTVYGNEPGGAVTVSTIPLRVSDDGEGGAEDDADEDGEEDGEGAGRSAATTTGRRQEGGGEEEERDGSGHKW
jgi:hypothetical protein